MSKRTRWFLIILALLTIFIWSDIAKSPADMVKNETRVFFFNVGQGDSILIEKDKYQILIDGGPDDTILRKLGEAMPMQDRKIETVILTHPHADHLTGLREVLDRYEIEKIYFTNILYDSNGYTEFTNKLKEKKIDYEVPEIGEELNPFENSKLIFLWPGKMYDGKTIENANDSSEMVQFCYFQQCLLLTGDIETTGQVKMFQKLKEMNLNINSDILKIPHHGSVNGTDQILLDIIKPKYAVIEVGADNKYGHPHATVLDLLQKNNIKIYRTDRDGDIKFILSEGEVIKE